MFALGIASGISYYFGYPRLDQAFIGNITLLCAPTTLVPGILLILFGRRARTRGKELVDFAAWVKTYRRIPLPDLAAKLGKPALEAEQRLVEAVDRGLVKGFIDRATEEFVLQEAVEQEQFIENCPRCGGHVRRRYFLGETVVCPYCNAVIAQKRRDAPP